METGFLNLEYFFYTVYRLFSGTDVSALPERFAEIVNTLQFVGIALSIVLFAALIYTKMRASQVHHAIGHAREEEMEEVIEHEKVKNERWGHVMNLINSSNSSDWRQAILEADIVLGLLLEERQIPGDTIGDKLKAVNRSHFTTLDLAWEAHKVRNEIAHAGSSYELTQREARRAIDLFRRVFEEFDHI